ncbi:MAG: UvrD-helicase domain-containing protein [Myxococcales bacterium]|nr:UvrD-helicase domain-containing protein [Myxococcales bacterium]
MISLDGLNPEQRQAVITTEGPLLVLAGAGSGKTRVITFRIAWLLDRGVPADRILALSFTNKAAGEMRERVLSLVGKGAEGCTLSTFHALGLRFLREEHAAAGLSAGFTILDEGDQIEAVRLALVEKGFDLERWPQRQVHARLSWYKGRLSRIDATRGGVDAVAAQVTGLYHDKLRAMNAVDFDDLIARPVWVLKRDADAAYRWAGRFQYIMVDEFQDTNAAQLELLKGLAKRYANVCAVGDDDQSIYGWRGAVAGNILGFDRHFPGAQIIALTRNYRSTNHILRAANHVIENNAERHEKALWSDHGDGEKLRYRLAEDGDDEAHWVATDLLRRQRAQRLNWNDFAILYRTNAQSRLIEEAVRGASIPYRLIGGTRFYDRKEVRDLIAYLRVIANPFDEAAYRRIVNYPPRGIGDKSVHRLGDYSRDHGVPFWRLVERPEGVPGIPPAVRTALEGLHALLAEYRRRFAQPLSPLGEICQELVDTLDFRNHLTRADDNARRVQRRMENLEEVASALTTFRERNPAAPLEDYISRLSLDSRREEDGDASTDEVSLMTLHGSKGLEFTAVYLVGCEEGFLPHHRGARPGVPFAGPSPAEVAEERRLMYVGITRAKRSLTVTAARKRLKFGRTQARRPSRFLHEIPEKLFEGGRKGVVAELTGDALQKKGLDAFAEMFGTLGKPGG